ncbi:methyltransferase, partial [Coniochaeta sp. 2T2.1]
PPDVKDRIKRTYDRIGPAYNSVTITIPLRRLEYLDRLLSYVYDSPPGLSAIAADRPIKVLDLGCGSGVPVMEKLLYDGGRFHVVANDISTTQIMLGRALLGGAPGTVDWVESGMMELDFPDDSFDAVMAFYSLFHVPREEQATLFGMIRGWLRPGGYVIMNFPELNQDGFDEDEWYCAKGWMFWSGWGPERTLEKIRAAGLEILVHEMADDDQPFLWVIARK